MTEQNADFDFTSVDSNEDAVNEAPVEKARRTPLSSLKDALAKKVEKEPVTYKIPGRDGFEMRFSTNLDQDILENYRKSSTRRRKGRSNEEEVDGMSLASKVLFYLNEAIVYDGTDATDDDGNVLKLQSRALGEYLGAESRSAIGILRELYGYDGHILATMQDVLIASGYDTDVDIDSDEDDPTSRS